jgi:bidirectional [NiFe] hydrogenase diaphorase subunit
MSESCGKCIPCRTGTWQMHELLDRITKSKGTHKDLALLEELCDVVQATSLCGLGQSAPNPVLSTLRYFREEYEAKLTAE